MYYTLLTIKSAFFIQKLVCNQGWVFQNVQRVPNGKLIFKDYFYFVFYYELELGAVRIVKLVFIKWKCKFCSVKKGFYFFLNVIISKIILQISYYVYQY